MCDNHDITIDYETIRDDQNYYETIRDDQNYYETIRDEQKQHLLHLCEEAAKGGPPYVGLCDECHQACRGITMDVGNGPYEHFGQRGNDVRMVYVSDCCESDILDVWGHFISGD